MEGTKLGHDNDGDIVGFGECTVDGNCVGDEVSLIEVSSEGSLEGIWRE